MVKHMPLATSIMLIAVGLGRYEKAEGWRAVREEFTVRTMAKFLEDRGVPPAHPDSIILAIREVQNWMRENDYTTWPF